MKSHCLLPAMFHIQNEKVMVGTRAGGHADACECQTGALLVQVARMTDLVDKKGSSNPCKITQCKARKHIPSAFPANGLHPSQWTAWQARAAQVHFYTYREGLREPLRLLYAPKLSLSAATQP